MTATRRAGIKTIHTLMVTGTIRAKSRAIWTVVQIVDRVVSPAFPGGMHTGTDDHKKENEKRAASQGGGSYEKRFILGVCQMVIFFVVVSQRVFVQL